MQSGEGEETAVPNRQSKACAERSRSIVNRKWRSGRLNGKLLIVNG